MSKNLTVIETNSEGVSETKNYEGVSTVQFNTTEGGTATFKDTDEITVPTGTKNITSNGNFDVTEFANVLVQVPTDGIEASLETQTSSCDSSLGTQGGLKINHTSGERCIYVGYPNATPSSSLTANRFPYAIMVNVLTDNTIGGCCVGYGGTTGLSITVSLADGVITITGSTAAYLTNKEVSYKFYKIPVE